MYVLVESYASERVWNGQRCSSSAKKALGDGTVPTIADATHAAPYTVLLEQLAVLGTRVLGNRDRCDDVLKKSVAGKYDGRPTCQRGTAPGEGLSSHRRIHRFLDSLKPSGPLFLLTSRGPVSAGGSRSTLRAALRPLQRTTTTGLEPCSNRECNDVKWHLYP